VCEDTNALLTVSQGRLRQTRMPTHVWIRSEWLCRTGGSLCHGGLPRSLSGSLLHTSLTVPGISGCQMCPEMYRNNGVYITLHEILAMPQKKDTHLH